MNLCNRCGACCRVLRLEQSPGEVRAIAALARGRGIPPDRSFAAEPSHPLTPGEAAHRTRLDVPTLPETAHLYWSDQLTSDGRCQSPATRPSVCRGSPCSDQPVRDIPLADARSGYVYDQIAEFILRGDAGP